MFKLLEKDSGYILKSYDIMDLWKFITSNRKFEFDFFVGYKKYTTNEFLHLFLYETKRWKEYYELYLRLKGKPKTLKEHYNEERTKRKSDIRSY